MDVVSIIFLAIALSFDTFAVSITCGLIDRYMQFKQAARIAICFALFQAIMPLAGWFLGYTIKDHIALYGHWIALSLLSFIGIKMIYESLKKEKIECFDPHELKTIITLAVATSIDSFFAGITLALVQTNIPLLIFIIGFTTFLAGMLGMLFGKKLGNKFGKRFEIVGGIILIAIGLKIFFEN